MVLEGVEECFRRLVDVNRARLTRCGLFNKEDVEHMLFGNEEQDMNAPPDEVDIDLAEHWIENIEIRLDQNLFPKPPQALTPDLPIVAIWLYHNVLVVLAAKFSVIAADTSVVGPLSKERYPFDSMQDWQESSVIKEADFAAMLQELPILQRFPQAIPRVGQALLPEVENLIRYVQRCGTSSSITQRPGFQMAWRQAMTIVLDVCKAVVQEEYQS